MNLNLVFSRKYRWPEHYFSVWCLGNSQKLLTTNQFLVSTIFFTIINISFFNLRFDLFSIIAKKVNQIRNNVVCVLARLFFSWFAVHSRQAVAVLFNIFSSVKRNWSFTAHFSRLFYFLWLSFSKLDFEIMSSKKKETIYLSISLTNIPSWLWCSHDFVLPRWLFEPSEDWRKRNKGWGCIEVEVEAKIQYIKNCV